MHKNTQPFKDHEVALQLVTAASIRLLPVLRGLIRSHESLKRLLPNHHMPSVNPSSVADPFFSFVDDVFRDWMIVRHALRSIYIYRHQVKRPWEKKTTHFARFARHGASVDISVAPQCIIVPTIKRTVKMLSPSPSDTWHVTFGIDSKRRTLVPNLFLLLVNALHCNSLFLKIHVTK